MSRKKHNISYIKPQDPKFLRELKAQAGYVEGPTIDTKRGDPSAFEGWDDDEEDITPNKIDEEPTVVVLNTGDLTAEEAEAFKKSKAQEDANTRADLSKRVIFNRKSKLTNSEQTSTTNQPVNKKFKKSKQTKAILSFNEDEVEQSE